MPDVRTLVLLAMAAGCAHAPAPTAGWTLTRTGHFSVYAPGTTPPLALVRQLEDMRALLRAQFSPGRGPRPIDVVFLGELRPPSAPACGNVRSHAAAGEPPLLVL